MPYDEAWLADVLARGAVRLVGGVAPPAPPAMTERAFQSAVVRVAREAGWDFRYHTHNSRRSPSGFPDLILCHRDPGQVCYAVECKTDTGACTKAQEAWLAALAGSTGVVSAVWRPQDWESIVAQLRG